MSGEQMRGEQRPRATYDAEAKIQQVIITLNRILTDTSVPRNIRRACMQALCYLQNQSLSPAVRAANAISALDDVIQDPNMPSYTRIMILNIVTLLETIRD